MHPPPTPRQEPGFRTLDAPPAELLDACVRCGACVQSCPTYQELGVEPDDPRGRIFLIKAAGDGQLSIGDTFEQHIYACLDCRACETACPMGVQVGRLIEEARGEIRQVRPARGLAGRAVRAALHGLFPHPRRFEALGRLLWLGRRSGALRLGRGLMPATLRRAERFMPTPPWRSARARLGRRREPTNGECSGTVALLHGCVMNTLFADVTVDTAEVLTRNGWRVLLPRDQTCCGALHVHEGERDGAKELARRNIAAFEASGADAYLVNAAGCGSALKEYPVLLRNDPEWADRAAAFAGKVRDVHEFLAEQGWRAPEGAVPARAVYQDACHLAHAQRIRSQPRDLLRSLPGVSLSEMPNPDRCCGSAGIYNLTHPELAQSLLERKVADVPDDVDTLVTANPGCHLHLLRGLQEAGREVRVRHVMEMVASAYRAEDEAAGA
jgi:glycolate oxidase iron-sulfur subunit